MKKFKAALLVFLILSWPASLFGEIKPRIEYRYYPVPVASAGDVEAATAARQPWTTPGNSKPSRTEWRIDYTFNSVRKYAANCQVATYKISADCLITLPEYKTDDALLALGLRAYSENLRKHELQHCAIVGEHAGRFENWIDSLRFYNCGDIMDVIRQRYEGHMRECDAAQRAYDLATDFGRGEGADLNLLLPGETAPPSRVEEEPAVSGAAPPPAEKAEEAEEARPAEPFSHYYQDETGVWRNDGRGL